MSPLTLADIFRALPQHRDHVLWLAGLFPLVMALAAELLKGSDKRNLSLFVADTAILTGLLLVCLEAVALGYYRWELGGDPVRDIDIVLLFAPLYILLFSAGLMRFVHPLQELATIRRLKAFVMFILLGGVLLLIVLKTRIWVVFYAPFLVFLVLLAFLLYYIYWYFQRFLQAD